MMRAKKNACIFDVSVNRAETNSRTLTSNVPGRIFQEWRKLSDMPEMYCRAGKNSFQHMGDIRKRRFTDPKMLDWVLYKDIWDDGGNLNGSVCIDTVVDVHLITDIDHTHVDSR